MDISSLPKKQQYRYVVVEVIFIKFLVVVKYPYEQILYNRNIDGHKYFK